MCTCWWQAPDLGEENGMLDESSAYRTCKTKTSTISSVLSPSTRKSMFNHSIHSGREPRLVILGASTVGGAVGHMTARYHNFKAVHSTVIAKRIFPQRDTSFKQVKVSLGRRQSNESDLSRVQLVQTTLSPCTSPALLYIGDIGDRGASTAQQQSHSLL